MAIQIHSRNEGMDQANLELQYRIEHRHKDGSWAEMEEDRPHHDSAGHDSERSWGIRRVFRCRTCPESAVLIPGEEGGPPAER
jgi:hypothetical protein